PPPLAQDAAESFRKFAADAGGRLRLGRLAVLGARVGDATIDLETLFDGEIPASTRVSLKFDEPLAGEPRAVAKDGEEVAAGGGREGRGGGGGGGARGPRAAGGRAGGAGRSAPAAEARMAPPRRERRVHGVPAGRASRRGGGACARRARAEDPRRARRRPVSV